MKVTVPGVYISYPFCAQKCTFCNFASGVYPRELERRYLETLRREIAACEFPWRPETVYLGGGTPSGMDAGDLGSLLALVPGRPWTEATIEAAPGGITRGEGARLARGRHQSRLARRAVVRAEGNRAHRTQAHGRDRRRRKSRCCASAASAISISI